MLELRICEAANGYIVEARTLGPGSVGPQHVATDIEGLLVVINDLAKAAKPSEEKVNAS